MSDTFDRDRHGFVWTATPVRSVSGDEFVIVNEHPACRERDGGIIFAPHRIDWRDAPGYVADTFVPRSAIRDEHTARQGRYPAGTKLADIA